MVKILYQGNYDAIGHFHEREYLFGRKGCSSGMNQIPFYKYTDDWRLTMNGYPKIRISTLKNIQYQMSKENDDKRKKHPQTYSAYMNELVGRRLIE